MIEREASMVVENTESQASSSASAAAQSTATVPGDPGHSLSLLLDNDSGDR